MEELLAQISDVAAIADLGGILVSAGDMMCDSWPTH